MTLQLLLAEDDPQLREVLIEALTLESFAVTACDNAEDALDIAAKKPFDLALFDVVMGGMTGIDALTTLRRLQPNIGIIITTAFATVDIAVDAMKKGADEFLTKPFNLAALSVTLKRVHAEHAPKADIAESEHDQIFSALSNPIRRTVVKQLKLHRKVKFMDLCRMVGIEDHTKFNFHLRQLVNSGLVSKEEGRVYSLTAQGMQIYASLLK
ncbi:response regulator [Vibrio fluvialis]|uniref:response regulator n=1 Tax=Vibrio fluvialis TaxID=676 RepID=UPI000357B4E9|nr:response regulator [Vibrio fluvialis]EPP26593.1 putative two-component response regulator [Vibrio fluvialis I21563]MBL4241451.1 response regulator [Vibrio fluvialis]MBL4250402.1 response regulator [Vibrio fluvialis]MBY7844068.1 response regulator [Vibrio fluvialis]MBY7996141.1 response regulator [Vibrio fluvialis]